MIFIVPLAGTDRHAFPSDARQYRRIGRAVPAVRRQARHRGPQRQSTLSLLSELSWM
jgi:hypothetical protein